MTNATINALNSYWIASFSEFIATALLIILGNGVCAATSYKKMFANQPGKWVCIALGWATAVFVSATVSMSMGGVGHLNPAVTIMDTISVHLNTINGTQPATGIYANAMFSMNLSLIEASSLTFFVFLIFQFTGAIFGQLVIDFLNLKFIKDKDNDLLTIRAVHCTSPSYRNKEDKATIQNFAYEFIATIVLLGGIMAFGSKVFGDANSGVFKTIPVSFLIVSICVSLGSATGCAISPVRDIGPRIVFVTLIKKIRKDEYEKHMANWDYSWVPIVAPMIAGIIMGCFGLIDITLV